MCNWPYYLRDIAGFDQVLDCSQSGAGSNHIFNSVVNEIETDSNVNQHNTLIVVMWSGLTRTDVVATQDITGPYHFMSNYNFDKKFSTLNIWNDVTGSEPLSVLCQQYKRLVDTDAQIYESMLKIVALESYLKQKGYNYIFTSWMDPTPELDRIDSPLTSRVLDSISGLTPYLNEHANQNNQKAPDGHPAPDGYLSWTRQCLIPYLESRNLIQKI